MLDILSRSGDIRDQSLNWYKIDRNLHDFGPSFLGGAPLEVLDLDYKMQPVSDHVEKFQGDRLTDFGERVANQKKHLGQNISPSGTVVPGGLNNHKNPKNNVVSAWGPVSGSKKIKLTFTHQRLCPLRRHS